MNRPVRGRRPGAAGALALVAVTVLAARLAVEAAGRGRLTGPYVSVLLGGAETDLLAAQGTFESRQPPGETADAVRERLGTLLDDAADALAEVRIGARRGEVHEPAEHTGDLREAAGRLEDFEEEMSS
ncbi:hypothetical protein [Streptomyces sp. cmx-4-7]|uniref:hypothetical protein n=1 Tax=Streptomyces sp. cmx-4-7 TaxID=2790939 RepID=UPI00397F2C22